MLEGPVAPTAVAHDRLCRCSSFFSTRFRIGRGLLGSSSAAHAVRQLRRRLVATLVRGRTYAEVDGVRFIQLILEFGAHPRFVVEPYGDVSFAPALFAFAFTCVPSSRCYTPSRTPVGRPG